VDLLTPKLSFCSMGKHSYSLDFGVWSCYYYQQAIKDDIESIKQAEGSGNLMS
jgi:hypothetical protein